jgi:hypothetical protein
MREKKTPSRSERKERERKNEACRRVLTAIAAVRNK